MILEEARRFYMDWFLGVLGFDSLASRLWGRDFGDPKRRFIPGLYLDSFLAEMSSCSGRRPCFLSVNYYSGMKGKPGTPVALEKLFFDIDSPNDLEKAKRDTLKLVEVLETVCQPLVVFSGGKGYHVYCYINPVVEGEKEYLKLVLEQVIASLDIPPIQSLDERVVGDVSRLSRVPYTIHEKTGNLTTLVDERNLKPIDPDSINLSRYWSRPIPRKLIEQAENLAQELSRLKPKTRRRKKIKLEDASWLMFFEKPELLKEALKGVTGELRTKIARELALYYRNILMLSRGECLNKLLEWNKKNIPPLSIEEVEKIVDEVYMVKR